MKAYAMYTGYADVNIPKGRIYTVGYYPALKSYTIRCKGREFVYSKKEIMLINWKFFIPISSTPDMFEDIDE